MIFQKQFGKRGDPRLIEYRLYYLDSVDRLISGSTELEAADDESAIAAAEKIRNGRSAELWSRERKIKAWTA